MPSPFPGMDPYLEGPLWPGFHTQLLAEIARQLAPRLRPKYVANTAERFVICIPEASGILRTGVYPDVGVAEGNTTQPQGGGGAALLVAPLHVATILPEGVPHVTVEIIDVASRKLVTAIEVLSPTNKQPQGREEYLAKRGRILKSPAHLLEIDLLRDGARVPTREPLPPAPYFAFVSRAENRPVMDVWPIGLQEKLPRLPVPLLPGDKDVVVELQEAFTNVYDLLGYDLRVDYSGPPPGKLSQADAKWMGERVGGGAR